MTPMRFAYTRRFVTLSTLAGIVVSIMRTETPGVIRIISLC
jgi:hypothetical protein